MGIKATQMYFFDKIIGFLREKRRNVVVLPRFQ